jgi:acetylornithine aminotransferase
VIDPPPDYLDQVEEVCRETGVLLILDEVQTGLCRTGKWFAFQHSSISPDIVLLAKALGNGIPIGAIWAKEAVAGAFQAGDHGSTFGGGALATAVGLCVVNEMERLGIADAANRSSSILRDSLMRIGLVKSLSGRGLLIGVELTKPVAAKFVSLALEYGLVLSHTGPQRLRLAPPLVITPDEIAKGIAIFERVANEFG